MSGVDELVEVTEFIFKATSIYKECTEGVGRRVFERRSGSAGVRMGEGDELGTAGREDDSLHEGSDMAGFG